MCTEILIDVSIVLEVFHFTRGINEKSTFHHMKIIEIKFTILCFEGPKAGFPNPSKLTFRNQSKIDPIFGLLNVSSGLQERALELI